MKKILLFLAVIMACTLSAASASVVASGTHDTNLTWKLDDAGVLTISGDGEMTDFIDFGSYDWRAANIKEATKTVVIEDGVTGIGAYAFMNFPALTRVSMADSVTRIGDKAFYECGSLSDVYLSENLETIGSSAFFNCNAISEADLPEQLVSIGDSAFYSCDQLATAHLPERLVSIGEKAFDSCDKLSPVLIPSAVTSIGNYAFDGCHSLEEITIPATVISMGKYVFSNCTSLKTAVVEEGVIALPEGTFNNCYMLESVTLPSTLTSIGGWAFNTGSYGTTYPMTSVSIPDSVVAIGEYAFNCQTGLSEIHLPAGLQSIGQKAFSRCLALTEVTIPDGTESIGAEAFLGDTALLKMTIPRSVIEIGANAFLDCDQLNLYCYESSEAHTYAGEQSIPFVLLEEANTTPPPAPTNICWKEGSTATAAWDPVSGASYYRITVRVFCEGQEIGNTMTGTADAEIDVQAEINQIMQSEGVTQAVQVAFSVSAARESEQGTYEYGDESSPSEFLLYELGATYLSTPEDVAVNTEGIASWKAVGNANYYYVLLEMKRTSDEESEQFVTGTYNQPDENGIVTFDMTQSINFLGYGSQSEDIALMRIQVSASPADQTQYMSSPYSEFTAFVEYLPQQYATFLPAPENVEVNTDGVATWKAVENASYYYVLLEMKRSSGEENSYVTGTYNPPDEEGIVTFDMTTSINFLGFGDAADDAVMMRIQVSASPSNQILYMRSPYSDFTAYVEYHPQQAATNLDIPKDVAVNTEGIASWKAVENANYYYVLLEMKRTSDDESELFVTGTYNQPDENGVVTFDMTQSINFLGYGSQSEDIALMRIQVSASPADQTQYMSSPYSEFTAFVEYHPLPAVESFILSPSSPILYVGHSLYLGRTIIPEDAYYTSISYASSDDEVVSVGDDGQIRGVNTGSAEITAIIGTITASVPVTVYAISSNIEDSETNIEVTDTAGSIIDLIGNNEEPDLSNTDISADLTDDLRDQILEGIERGDEFHADWWWKWYGWEHYRSWWEYILALLNDGRYATGYDAGFEMYHQNGQEKHHIGNITEFEKEIDFVFDMPENLPATDAGHHREYTLIRIHDGQIEEIPVEFDSHGKFRGKSDRFSDFVLMYQDKEDLTTVASGRCGEKVSWALDQDGVLTVSGSGATEACSPTEEPWHAFKEQIKEVIISEGVTALEAGFSACPALTRVALPSTIQHMSPGVFKNCQRLNDIVIPDGISTKEIPYYQDGCLRVVSVPANCECTGSVFEGCTIGREIVPDFVLPEDLTAVETEAFEGTSMIYLRIPGSVEKIGSRAFADCSCLKYVYIDAHHGNDLEIAENAFEGCNGLMFIGYINEALEHMIEENDYGIVENPV